MKVKNFGWDTFDEETKLSKRAIELNNGRAVWKRFPTRNEANKKLPRRQEEKTHLSLNQSTQSLNPHIHW